MLHIVGFWKKLYSFSANHVKTILISINHVKNIFILTKHVKNSIYFHKIRKKCLHLYKSRKKHPHTDKTRKNNPRFRKTRKNYLHKFQFTSKLYSINRNHVKIILIAAICAENSFIQNKSRKKHIHVNKTRKNYTHLI